MTKEQVSFGFVCDTCDTDTDVTANIVTATHGDDSVTFLEWECPECGDTYEQLEEK